MVEGGGAWYIPHAMDPTHRLAEHHLFHRMGLDILFNVETMLFYRVEPVVRDLVELLAEASPEDPVGRLRSRYSDEEIGRAAALLKAEGILRSAAPARPRLRRRVGIRHLELMVTHDCNLRCRYCYGAEGPKGWAGTTGRRTAPAGTPAPWTAGVWPGGRTGDPL